MSSKRANGEGGLFRRKDGRWDAVVDLGFTPDGRRKRIKRTRRTKAEAAAAMAEVRAELGRGLEPAAARFTVKDWLERWLEDEAETSVRPRTLLMYQANVRRHLVPQLGHIALRKLTPLDVKRFVQKQSADCRPQTVRNQHATLRRALEVAVRYRYVDVNVARLVSPPTVRRDEVKPLTAEEMQRFLAAARGRHLEALFVLAAATGMRLAEVLGLTWEHVDLAEGTCASSGRSSATARRGTSTRRRRARAGARWRWRRPRSTPCATTATARSSPSAARTGRATNGASSSRTPSAGRCTAATCGTRCRRSSTAPSRSSGASASTTCGTAPPATCSRRGVPLKVVQDVLGHAQISTTADIYGHIVPELRRDAAERIGAVLFGG